MRLQTQPKPKPGESLLYAGTIDCFKKTLAKEVRAHTNVTFFATPSIEIASKKLNLSYSVPPSLLSLTGCERALQRHGSPHRRSHTHVCCLLLWVRTGQEAATEKPRWYSHVGPSAIANASVQLKLCGWSCALTPVGIHSCLLQECCQEFSPRPSWLLASALNASYRSEVILLQIMQSLPFFPLVIDTLLLKLCC